MGMTRKDYVVVAKSIVEARYTRTNDLVHAHAIDEVVNTLALAFAEQNSNFKASVFYQACQYGKLPREGEKAPRTLVDQELPL